MGPLEEHVTCQDTATVAHQLARDCSRNICCSAWVEWTSSSKNPEIWWLLSTIFNWFFDPPCRQFKLLKLSQLRYFLFGGVKKRFPLRSKGIAFQQPQEFREKSMIPRILFLCHHMLGIGPECGKKNWFMDEDLYLEEQCIYIGSLHTNSGPMQVYRRYISKNVIHSW